MLTLPVATAVASQAQRNFWFRVCFAFVTAAWLHISIPAFLLPPMIAPKTGHFCSPAAAGGRYSLLITLLLPYAYMCIYVPSFSIFQHPHPALNKPNHARTQTTDPPAAPSTDNPERKRPRSPRARPRARRKLPGLHLAGNPRRRSDERHPQMGGKAPARSAGGGGSSSCLPMPGPELATTKTPTTTSLRRRLLRERLRGGSSSSSGGLTRPWR